MSEPDEVGVRVPVLWVGDDRPVVKVNQFLLQVDQAGDVFVTLGTLTPPPIVAEDEDDFAVQAERIGFVPIRTEAKLSLSERGVHELIGVLQNGLAMLERQKGAQSQ